MSEYRYVYPTRSRETFSSALWIGEPSPPTYGVDHPAPEICRRLGNNIRHLRTLRRWSQEALVVRLIN